MSFDQLGLGPDILKAVADAGYTVPTPIQMQAIPIVLQGRDVLGCAQTGTGKTASFTLPMIEALSKGRARARMPRSLVLTPTRELATQISQNFATYGKYHKLTMALLIGGVSTDEQQRKLGRGVDVLIATPGRLLDLFERGSLLLNDVKFLVIDEADRMLDMGFEEALDVIFSPMPNTVQTLLFSATFTEQIERIAEQNLTDPVTCKVEAAINKPAITQLGYKVLPHTRIQTLKALLTHYQPKNAIVFCNRRVQVNEVVEELTEEGFSAAGLQGDMEQIARTAVLMQFASDALQVLVATDVAARGLDIDDIECVINYTVSEEPETHIHRIGRTARAGAKGTAITLVGDEEEHFLRKIEVLQESDIEMKGAQALRFHKNRIVLPDFTCISLGAGKKQKLRPGDLVGALTKDAGIPGDDVGKIAVQNSMSFVALKTRSVKRAMALFRDGKIKGKRVRARKL